MIIVKNRELLVPLPERYLGTDYDISSEVRQFQVPRFAQNGVDLSALTFRCDFFFADGTRAYDTITLGKEVSDEYIVLTWNITRTVLQSHPGTLFIQLRAIDGEATVRWGSYRAAFYVERHLNAPGNYEGSDLSEIEQMEQDYTYFKSVIEQVAGLPQYVDEAEAWAVGTRNGHAVAEGDETYNNNAKYWRGLARQNAFNSEAYALGRRDGVPVEEGDYAYNNNARYYRELAKLNAINSEAYAFGKREGVNVDPTDVTYNNNSKYYSEVAHSKVIEASYWATGAWNGGNVQEGSEYYHNNAKYYANDAEAWATGSFGGGPLPSGHAAHHNNAEYYAGLARQSASSATGSEIVSGACAETAEAYALGTRNGTDVASTDDAYHNNAKYYADLAKTSELNAEESASMAEAASSQAQGYMSEAGLSATSASQHRYNASIYAGNARDYARNAEAYAVGTRNLDPVDSSDDAYHNNAKYYAELAASSTFQVPATASDVGKFLRVKTVAGGVVTEYELVDIASAFGNADTTGY